jgi:hypothetical protein
MAEHSLSGGLSAAGESWLPPVSLLAVRGDWARTFGRTGRRTSTSGTSDLQAYRDTATIAITVMMAAISASWMIKYCAVAGRQEFFTFGLLLLGQPDPGLSHFK